MDRFPFPGFPFPWTRGTAVTMTATLCLSLGGCFGLGGEPPPTGPTVDDRPMVAPTATPSSNEFNLKVATPLTNPAAPVLVPVPVLTPPPPPVTLTPLSAPEPIALAALPPLTAPAAPPQRGKPIPPPPGAPHDTVSAVEEPPAVVQQPSQHPAASAPSATPATEPRRSVVSLPTGGGTTAPTSYRLVFTAQSLDMPDTSSAVLQQLAAMMTQDQRLRLKLNSFASGSSDNPVVARQLSLKRALKVREALVGLGVSSLRVDVLALGLTAAEPPNDRVDIVPAN